MRWSFEELFKAWKIRNAYTFKEFILDFFPRNWRKTGTFFHWLFKGYTKESLWNLDETFDQIILQRLKQFRKMERAGFPNEFNSQEEWNRKLDELIQRFDDRSAALNRLFSLNEFTQEELHELIAQQEEKNKKTIKLFAKYYDNLWD